MTVVRKTWVSMLAAATLLAGSGQAKPPAVSDALAMSKSQAEAALFATRFLTRFHYRRMPLDDAMSQRILDQYLKSLDGDRSVFLASDVAGFKTRYGTRLDDAIYDGEEALHGDLEAPFEIFRLYLMRAHQRYAHAQALLDRGFDFSQPESYSFDRERVAWAKSPAELDDLWRKRVKNDWLRLRLAPKSVDADAAKKAAAAGTTTPPKPVVRSDQEIRDVLRKRYRTFESRLDEVNNEDVFQSFLNAYATSIEPHTGYLAPDTSENFNIQMSLSLEGIGAVLSRDEDFTAIQTVVKGGPADQSDQIKVGDKILAVGQGNSGPMVDVIGWRLDDVVKLIRGQKGTSVRLDVLPKTSGSDGKPMRVSLVRDRIKLEEQAAKSEIIEVGEGAAKRKIGLIELGTFYHDFEGQRRGDAEYRSSTRDVRRLLTKLKGQGVSGVVLDLRGNGGGSLAEATQLTGLFIPSGPVVQVREATGKISVESDTDPSVAWDGPLAVMVDRASASASEIFAAAMQDYGRGLIIGETTFGKGTVQNMLDLDRMARNEAPTYGQLKLTVAQFFRVNGGSTQHKGVEPDIAFPTTWDADEFGESSYDNALPWTSVPSAQFERRGDFASLVPQLEARHVARIARDQEYQWWLQDLEDYRKQRGTKSVSLLESARRAERDQIEARSVAREKARADAGTTRKDRKLTADDGLDAVDQRAGDEEEDAEDEKPDVLAVESARILSDAIDLLRGNPSLASRVGAFHLVASRGVSTAPVSSTARRN